MEKRGIKAATLVLSCLFGVLVGFGQAQGRWPTPEISKIEPVEVSGGVAYAMRGEVGETGEYVGLAVICRRAGADRIEARVFFGSFPGRGKRVQLAVKDPAGRVERFGPVLSGSPAAGFHSPLLSDSEEAKRFARAALQPGSLISNGHRSFWNRAGEPDNQRVLGVFLGCAEGG